MNAPPALLVPMLVWFAACAPATAVPEPAVLRPEPLPSATEPALPATGGASYALAEARRVPVGVIHSQSGLLEFEETPLIHAALMAIDEINERGGVLGEKLSAVVVDPASNWPLFAEKARELVQKENVRVVFGGYTSVSRKSMLPVLEELKGLLFYPAQHEGEESSSSIVYTGSIPNQSVSVVADYLARRKGAPIKRWFVIGTDYVVPRTQAKILRDAWLAARVPDGDIFTVYTPFGHSDYQQIVGQLRKFAKGGPTAVISLLFRESAVSFQQELVRQNVSPRTTPVVSFGLDERTIAKEGTLFAGTLVARSYFGVINTPENIAFKRLIADYAREHDVSPEHVVSNDDVEATYIGVNLWKQAVESAKSFDTNAVTVALANQTFAAPSGFTVSVDPVNHHLHKPYFVAEVDGTGSLRVVWQTPTVIPPLAPSPR